MSTTARVITSTLLMIAGMIMVAIVMVNEESRMKTFAAGYDGRSIEAGAAIYANNCISCHGPNGEGSIGPALNTATLFDPNGRVAELKWKGTVRDFVYATVAGGRPTSALTYGDNKMPTWSDRFGGPLRDDQIRDVVAFIMNWEKNFDGTVPATAVPIDAVGADIKTPELPAGDAERGKEIATTMGCVACHNGTAAGVGPSWESAGWFSGEPVSVRAEARLADPNYTGAATTAEEYLREAIVRPGDFLVYKEDGTQYPNAMTPNYGERLEAQDLADLIAYLLSLK